MPVHLPPVNGARVPPEQLRAWTAGIVELLGTPPDIAADVAEVLVASDRRGIASHGTARMPIYVALVDAGVLDPAARPARDAGRGAIARFDANNGWGHHAARVATDWAIEAALEHGIASAVVHHSNHYGIAGWYALRAAEHGLIGISLTNTSPVVAPTRSAAQMLGTNPIAVAAPAGRHGTFCLDMATSAVSRGQIEVAARRGEAVPVGWAINADGRPATTVEDALAGALQPLGGAEESSGYKGYGLALVVEMLTGILAGSTIGPDIVPLFSESHGVADLGHGFIVIDPTAVDAPGVFEKKLEHLVDQLTGAPTIAGAPGRVLMPGEPEAEAEARSALDGVDMDEEHLHNLRTMGERFGLPFPEATPIVHGSGAGA
jgi:LDH2 family malate/lactate/ureidoglycolate dehydrogenase